MCVCCCVVLCSMSDSFGVVLCRSYVLCLIVLVLCCVVLVLCFYV